MLKSATIVIKQLKIKHVEVIKTDPNATFRFHQLELVVVCVCTVQMIFVFIVKQLNVLETKTCALYRRALQLLEVSQFVVNMS